jgi:hypothetical protein
MQWSKMRSQLRSFTAPELHKRIDFHLINYRKLSELANEFIVTIDGRKVFAASTSRHNIATHVLTRTTGMLAYGDGPEPKTVDDLLAESEIHAPTNITSSVRTYFDLHPHVALTSSDPILRALAIIDRRIGRRTLAEMKVPDEEHSLVKSLYAVRMASLA